MKVCRNSMRYHAVRGFKAAVFNSKLLLLWLHKLVRDLLHKSSVRRTSCSLLPSKRKFSFQLGTFKDKVGGYNDYEDNTNTLSCTDLLEVTIQSSITSCVLLWKKIPSQEQNNDLLFLVQRHLFVFPFVCKGCY